MYEVLAHESSNKHCMVMVEVGQEWSNGNVIFMFAVCF